MNKETNNYENAIKRWTKMIEIAEYLGNQKSIKVFEQCRDLERLQKIEIKRVK